ncbi:transposase [Streptomyces sp. KLMMK]|uniref:transposase n=1 Tax=Streptomyces sp. KLMMK TaxID=3109353 RepID=UPI0030097207
MSWTLSTHSTPAVKEWLAKNPHVHFHFTPIGSFWLNQIEIWFGIITRQSIRRGTFSCQRPHEVLLAELNAASRLDWSRWSIPPTSGP